MIYLDHAATSFPKPAAVLAEMQRWFTDIGVSPDRGDGPGTREARAVMHELRAQLASRTGTTPDRIAFCSGATEGLNLVLRALLPGASRVATTVFEHSSVARPLVAERERGDLQVDVIGGSGEPDESACTTAAVATALCEHIAEHRPQLVVFSHASNVTGSVLDAARICATAREHGTRTVLDASQSAGYLPLDCGADVVVASAHKAMHGPPGLGFVATRADLELPPQKHGGTGSSAALEHHPTTWPQAFEAGTPNTPALFGLLAALRWLHHEGEANLLSRSLTALDQLADGLRQLPQLRLLVADTLVRVPVLSLTHQGYDPAELGAVLAGADVHSRAGFHCAPWIHAQLGTEQGGTLRFATGPETSRADIETVLDLLASL